MMHILDEIVLPSTSVDAVRSALQQDYLSGAEGRGLRLLNQWVSPPVGRPGHPNTLWLLWELPGDPMAWYGMRSQQGPEVEAFWRQVDAQAQVRRRHVLGDANEPLPVPTGAVTHAL